MRGISDFTGKLNRINQRFLKIFLFMKPQKFLKNINRSKNKIIHFKKINIKSIIMIITTKLMILNLG